PRRDERPRREDRLGRDERPRREDRFARDERPGREDRLGRDERPGREDRLGRDERPGREDRLGRDERPAREERPRMLSRPEEGMERFRIEVGLQDGVKPANIVGAVANEAGLENEFIGTIEIYDDYSTIDLPEGMPREVFDDLKAVWVCNKQLSISRANRTDRRAAKFGGAGRRGKIGGDKPPRRTGRKPVQAIRGKKDSRRNRTKARQSR
ncbi:MAG: DbpA RNA binding domain-containing protein, partial [Myxococcota bacterium]|nr:DbpA RNA binding domain-containing protein [Myxococcota bacterium]